MAHDEVVAGVGSGFEVEDEAEEELLEGVIGAAVALAGGPPRRRPASMGTG